MKTLKVLFFAVLIATTIICCKEDAPIEKDTTITTFYFIRHAEKDRSDLENENPELNQDGLGRAIRWAEIFDPIAVDEIYITDYERVAMTAAPVAIKKEIDVKYYTPEDISVTQFIKDHKGKNILIVGHSNSTPDFVNKMIGEDKYETMDEYNNSSLFIVRFIGDTPTDIHLKMD